MSGAVVSDAVLMTLAGIAYGAPDDIADYIARAEPTSDGWSVAWLAVPADPPVNFAYMAVNGDGSAAVIAIRGTYPNPFSPAYWDDGDQDSPFGDMVNWPGASGAKIAGGTNTGFTNIMALQDSGGNDLAQAVAALPETTQVIVTGHSLGGTLAPVVALKLAELMPQRSIASTSFAGMTPGNRQFAALFSSDSAAGVVARRVYNTLDTVSYGWNKVWATHDFYQPEPQGGLVVKGLLLATEARLKAGKYGYAAIGDPVPLKGAVKPPTIGCDLVAYVIENLHQHMPDTYLALLGAPPLPFSILFGTIVASREPDTAAVSPDHHLPVVHIAGAS
ncbi:MAG: lipase [Pseudomonadota bacterium]